MEHDLRPSYILTDMRLGNNGTQLKPSSLQNPSHKKTRREVQRLSSSKKKYSKEKKKSPTSELEKQWERHDSHPDNQISHDIYQDWNRKWAKIK